MSWAFQPLAPAAGQVQSGPTAPDVEVPMPSVVIYATHRARSGDAVSRRRLIDAAAHPRTLHVEYA